MLIAGLWLAACTGSAPQPAVPAAVVHVEGGAGGVEAARRERDYPITAEDLAPMIAPRAPWGAAPTAIVIDLLHPVVTPEVAGEAPTADTALTLEPPVDGTLVWESPSRLRYDLTGAIPLDAALTVRLDRIQTRTGPLDLGASATIQTPRFALHHLELASTHAGSPDQSFEASFTGPVEPLTARDALTIVLPNGTRAPAVNVRAGSAPHKLRFDVASPALVDGGQVELELGPGVRAAAGDATAVPARKGALLPTAEGPGARILAVHAIEGGNGFVLDVVCDDDALGDDDRYWWDNEEGRSYELSRRCELDPASLGMVHVEPAVDLSIAPTGHGFRLSGAFARGSYAVHVDAGARTRDGGTFVRPWSGVLLVPGRAPEVRFVSQGRYLPTDGWRTLALQHRNVGMVDLTVRHVPRENLMFWLSSDRESLDERTSRLVVDTRVAVRGATDARETLSLDLTSVLPEPAPGVYEVGVRFGDSHDQMRVVVTDLALVAKRAPGAHGAESVQVWALDVRSLAGQSGVDVALLRPSGQALASCTTDAAGTCALVSAEDPVDDTPGLAIVATRGKELSYLSFRDVQVPQAEVDVSGEPFHGPAKVRGSLDAERGVVRPGETLHLVGVLRTADGFVAPPEAMPARLDVQDARGRVVRQIPTHGNAAGLVTAAISLSDDAPTGRWEARLVVADEIVARQTFAVEDFVPERMKVDARASADGYTLADAVPVDIAARYLFGGSAEGSRVELRCNAERSTFEPARNKGFRYGHQFTGDLGKRALELGVVTGTIDANGAARLECPAPRDGAALVGPARLSADVAVFEAG
ncbi:MAG TPA: MG2 domain-containing protein, partial [Myxococcota bacterium]|nr:MG2 domain-containing protein [Myxococcota bacterium]